MDLNTIAAWSQVGAIGVMTLSALGSALGTGAAGSAAVGAWKRCYVQKKPAPFQLAVFVGAPLSQTIYGLILMILINGRVKDMLLLAKVAAGTATDLEQKAAEGLSNFIDVSNWPMLLFAGIFAGLAMGISAWMQGRAAAGACDAFAETGEGFTNNLMVLGVIETTALFAMVFAILVLP